MLSTGGEPMLDSRFDRARSDRVRRTELRADEVELADVDRLYHEAEAEHALVEIELDTSQLRAITAEEAAAILEAADLEPMQSAAHPLEVSPEFSNSLEALLRLSWPVWKGPEKPVGMN
jgi:hypothetical protein